MNYCLWIVFRGRQLFNRLFFEDLSATMSKQSRKKSGDKVLLLTSFVHVELFCWSLEQYTDMKRMHLLLTHFDEINWKFICSIARILILSSAIRRKGVNENNAALIFKRWMYRAYRKSLLRRKPSFLSSFGVDFKIDLMNVIVSTMSTLNSTLNSERSLFFSTMPNIFVREKHFSRSLFWHLGSAI